MSLNLDENLVSKDTPVDNIYNSMMFNAGLDRNAIFGSRIRNISADKITAGTIDSSVIYGGTITGQQLNGGTITVGGTANGDGVIQVLNASGGTITTINNTGITVTGGSISIKNSGGTDVIDTLGLNSVNNFYSDAVTGGSFDTSVGASMQNIPGGTLSSLVLTRNTKCFIYVAINGQNYVAGQDCRATVYDTFSSGTLTNFVANFNGQFDGSNYFNQLIFLGRIFTLAAGTHTLNIQARDNGSGTCHIAGWELGLIKLGN